MSSYRFPPPYSYDMGYHSYACWRGGFNDDELQQIIELGDSLPRQKAVIGKSKEEDNVSHYRRSEIAWIQESDCPWLYARLAWICQQLNGKFYNFDLWGFHEDMQYTVYSSSVNAFYDWHIDTGEHIENNIDRRLPRKLSLVLQLSEPDDYQGGNTEIKVSKNKFELPKDKGWVLAFPSYTLHRVTEVTKGIRRSLVVWATGPQFR